MSKYTQSTMSGPADSWQALTTVASLWAPSWALLWEPLHPLMQGQPTCQPLCLYFPAADSVRTCEFSPSSAAVAQDTVVHLSPSALLPGAQLWASSRPTCIVVPGAQQTPGTFEGSWGPARLHCYPSSARRCPGSLQWPRCLDSEGAVPQA